VVEEEMVALVADLEVQEGVEMVAVVALKGFQLIKSLQPKAHLQKNALLIIYQQMSSVQWLTTQ
jgi:hypothetical protein